jgi:Ser/Thr protein kinase RdoA (MazF antagonist)
MTYFPVTHSTLSADALLAYTQEHYDIGKLVECLLLSPGLNDTYLLRGKEQRYIVRVYRAGYRTLDDVLYEMDLLLHLHHKGAPVSYPLAMRDGRAVSTLNSLEGDRPVTLFTYDDLAKL